jgi:hypothetical protein
VELLDRRGLTPQAQHVRALLEGERRGSAEETET